MKTTIKYIFLIIGISANAQLVQETITYSYDNLNRLVQVVFNDGATKNYTYDNLGNRIQLNIQSLSIESETLQNTITIYPNPTENNLNVQLPKGFDANESKVSLYDINGRVITDHASKIKNGIVQLDVSQLTTGIYLLHIKSAQKVWSQLFIKK